jgi:oxepin-CoA hydrolase / 3-oxo-5,6-dehydrosuberyl-CoA semialdehyde dehydrogenase
MGNLSTLQSFIGGRWLGQEAHMPLHSALDNQLIFHTHAEKIDFGEALHYARKTGIPELMKLDFQKRAQRLKALATYLMERKEELYEISHLTGATRPDSWVDVEGGIGTLFAYASIGGRELPSSNVMHEGPAMPLGKRGGFSGTHILVPRGGVAVHINAFNFPIWGLLEKFAPSFLAAMPCIGKPATATSYLTHAVVKMMMESNLLPEGSLQLVIGSTGDLLDRLTGFDAVTFTGSADTAAKLRSNKNLITQAVPFTAEADSLNAAILAPDVTPDDPEFDLFVKEVVREMTGKAGQKCTSIRRVIVPENRAEALGERMRERLAKVVVGNPKMEGVRMGALASLDQFRDVSERVAMLARGNEVVFSAREGFKPLGEGAEKGAFFSPTLLLCRDALTNDAVHDIEAFGPVSTMMTYKDVDEALELAARGKGSLVTTLVTKDPSIAAHVVPVVAASHGRVHILDREASVDSTGHGSPLPMLKHGGPGRAGGGEELGGIRAVKHFLQRAAVQGSPTMLTAVTGEYVRGGAVKESDLHPFRRYFEDLEVGHSLLTHRRTVSEADIVNFGGVSGDYFYMHFDDIAAKDTQFGKRIAHGYFVLSAAAGLFVSPAPGPVLANYGLDNLRFVAPVAIGDTIRARLTCKRKVDRNRTDEKGRGQGVVAWDVQVTNQNDELVASYDILTLVQKRG